MKMKNAYDTYVNLFEEMCASVDFYTIPTDTIISAYLARDHQYLTSNLYLSQWDILDS